MKIGKYILAGLLMSAVILPLSAQDKQYDVKLTVYPKEDKVKENKKEKKASEAALRDEYRDYRKAERSERQTARMVPAEPVKIEAAQSGKPYSSVRPAEASGVSYVADGQKDPTEATVVVYDREPTKIEPVHATRPGQPVRPRESYDPVGAGCCGKEECGGCCDKPCCKEQGKACCGKPACGSASACTMSSCGMQGMMPMFGCNAQYRDFKRMMRGSAADFMGDAFYLGTNALAYVALAPNMSLEWRRDEARSFRLAFGGFYWPWACDDDNNQSTYGFWVTPEMRFYLGEKKSWYAGPMVQFGYLGRTYDSYDYYNGNPECVNEHYMAVSAGGSFGYMQRVKRNFAIDYNISAGVSGVGHYDGYYAGSDTDWKCAFSLTNIGVSLVWQACSKPMKMK